MGIAFPSLKHLLITLLQHFENFLQHNAIIIVFENKETQASVHASGDAASMFSVSLLGSSVILVCMVFPTAAAAAWDS